MYNTNVQTTHRIHSEGLYHDEKNDIQKSNEAIVCYRCAVAGCDGEQRWFDGGTIEQPLSLCITQEDVVQPQAV